MKLTQEEALGKLQNVELDILDAFSAFCKQWNLPWFLDSGTVLGALRHNGFIPWDDDIDVGMMRPDFERLISLANAGELPRGYSLVTCMNTHGFGGMYAKISKDGTAFETKETRDAGFKQGIFIDIFPYDRLLSDKTKRKKQLTNARIWQSLSFLKQSGYVRVPHNGCLGFAERLLCKMAHPIVAILFRQDNLVQKYRLSIPNDTIETSAICVPLPYPLFHPERTLIPPSKLYFEGKEYPGPANPEEYLEVKYGNWRELPPENQRKTHLPLFLDFGDGDTYST